MSEKPPKDNVRQFRPRKVLVDTDWENAFITNKQGETKNCMHNIALILDNHKDWKGVLEYDEFADRIITRKPSPISSKPIESWSDAHLLETMNWFGANRDYQFDAAKNAVQDAVILVAKRHRIHPLRERMESFTWDGVPRVAKWLHTYLGAKDDAVHSYMGQSWLIGAVARLFNPGCKVDTTIILEGKQGARKSSALRLLALGYFTDDLPDLHSKDIGMHLAGVFIIEFSELDALSRSENSRTKAFVVRQVDRYRAPYDRNITERARSCVFSGSVNHDQYLTDETGNRRWWPVTVCDVDLEALARDVEHLWAETIHLYRAGTPWHTTDQGLVQELQAHVADRAKQDSWEDDVLAFVANKETVRSNDILTLGLRFEAKDIHNGHSNRVAQILYRTEQWKHSKIRTPNGTYWAFVRKPVPA